MNVACADLLAVLAAAHRGSFGSFLHVHETLLDASSAGFGAVRPAAPRLHPATCAGGEEQETTVNQFTLSVDHGNSATVRK